MQRYSKSNSDRIALSFTANHTSAELALPAR